MTRLKQTLKKERVFRLARDVVIYDPTVHYEMELRAIRVGDLKSWKPIENTSCFGCLSGSDKQRTSMKLRNLSPVEINEAVQQVLDFGYCVVRGYLMRDGAVPLQQTASALHSELVRQGCVHESPVGRQKIISNDRVVNNAIFYDDNFLEIATRGDHLKIYSHFLNDPAYGLIPPEDVNFILGQANLREGATQLPFHVDTRMITLGSATWSMQGVLALSNKASRTGGLRVRPGSHLSGEFPDSCVDYQDAVDVDLESGDMAIFSSQLHHGTHPTDQGYKAGWAFNLTYRAWWVKQQFDFCRMLGARKVATLTANQQLILGACSIPPAEPAVSPSIRQGYEIL